MNLLTVALFLGIILIACPSAFGDDTESHGISAPSSDDYDPNASPATTEPPVEALLESTTASSAYEAAVSGDDDGVEIQDQWDEETLAAPSEDNETRSDSFTNNVGGIRCGQRGSPSGKFDEEMQAEEQAWDEAEQQSEPSTKSAYGEEDTATPLETDETDETGETDETDETQGEDFDKRRPLRPGKPGKDENDDCNNKRGLDLTDTMDDCSNKRGSPRMSDAATDDTDSLILGGRTTSIFEFPWQVSIHRNGRHICGGSIVAKRFILTAAHCLKEKRRRAYKIYAGKSNKQKGERGELGPFFIDSFVIHRQYGKKNRFDSDIALIRLTRPIPYSKRASPICLPLSDSGALPRKQRCFVSGFGKTKDESDADDLKAARVTTHTMEQCRRMTASWTKSITDNMICAGGLKSDDGTSCNGDSGGPLVCETSPNSGIFTLQGAVSFGKKNCGDKYTPSVYTRVSRFYNWIKVNAKALEKRAKSKQ